MSYTYKYERPAVTVDGVLFGVEASTGLEGRVVHVLLIERRHEPFQDKWALPGGFFDMADESAEDAVARELQEETGLTGVVLEQLSTFSKKGRDPRGRTISLAYVAVVERNDLRPVAADDAKAVRWFPLDALPELAFDHARIIDMAVDVMRRAGSRLDLDAPDAFRWLQNFRSENGLSRG